MRHGKKINHLGRKTAHRKALLRNLAIALITHKRINTTVAKAKALRRFVEPLVTKSKSNTTHSRRVVFSYLQDKEAIKELFSTVAEKVGDRPGGYVRVIRTGWRKGDGAEMAMIELVDFNEIYSGKSADGNDGGGKRKRRRRRGGKGAAAATTAAAPVSNEEEE
ncbi:MAG: 50S ribosomal protein L17 [Bacteroidetes bacterium]|jgi:large subunit ribosomal protein L17|nr:50S ribosomal protein L17 [Bacteroidota bacterium]MDF1865774.1 50S ribosomal protein L17 [Saprospiraceae bacterium]